METKRSAGSLALKAVLALFFLFAVLLPLIRMLSNMATTDVGGILSNPQFHSAALHSLLSSGTATLISVFLAFLLAWCITRSRIRFKEAWCVMFTLPMLIPSISHGMGLVILFGSNGILTNWLHLPFTIYGFGGIVIGSVLYSFPVAFLMLLDVLKYEDGTAYEAAAVLGISKGRQIRSLLLPYLRKPLISVIFATFTLIVTDYGVPLMVGGKYMTLPVMMYNEVTGLLDFGEGSVIGACLLIPAVAAFLIDLFTKESNGQNFVTRPRSVAPGRGRDVFCTLLCIVAGVLILLPIAAFVLLTFVRKYPVDMSFTFQNILKTMDQGAGDYLINSLIIAFSVALIGTAVSYLTAYLTARSRGISSGLLHLISITSLAIPGMVLGLSYSLFFGGSFLAGTLSILILVNMVHFFASPYLMAYNSLGKLNENLEAVGRTLGIGRVRMVLRIFVPQTRSTLWEMFSYFFVNSMMTISAVSFLSRRETMPLSLIINQFEKQMQLESIAFVSLLILAVNLLMKGIIALIRRRAGKKEAA